MNTPAHLVVGMAAFGRPGRPVLILAALIGALLPDLSLYGLAGWHLFVLGTPAETVFRELYYSDGWQAVFAVDNSVFAWAALVALGLALRRDWLMAGAAAALLHVGADFLLHNDDARRHLWPFSDWVFVSPVSYWDGAHYGDVVAPVETAVTLGLCVWIWRRFHGRALRALVAMLAVLQVLPTLMWALMF